MYNNPTPVAVALIRVATRLHNDIGLLAGRRTIDPCKGLFAFPGGYIDEMETAEMAASRELQEETGIIIPADQFKPVATRITPLNRLLVFCYTPTLLWESDLARFTPKPECDELTIVYETDSLCFSTHTDILQNWRW